MSGVGTLDSAEQEEFLAAVRRQSIGRLCDVRASNTLAGPIEQRLDSVKPSFHPVLMSTNHVDRGGAPLDSGIYKKTSPRGAATGEAEKERMMMMMMMQIASPTIEAYAKPSHPAPSTIRQMNRARTTPSSSVMPLRLKMIQEQQKQKQEQQAKAIATGVTMANPTATSAHRLVEVERTYQHQLPLASPLQDVADRWARELSAARERRKELKRQFKRDFGIGYGGYYHHY